MSKSLPTFAVDKKGLAQILERRGKAFAIVELWQNAVDEEGVTRVDVSLTRSNGADRGVCHLVVEDDAPEGFHDLSHAFTLFAPSRKKADPSKRGRFNLGEKLVIAVCESALIETTTGAVEFAKEGRIHHPRRKREMGSVFQGTIRMTRAEMDEALKAIRSCIPPAGVVTTVNGDTLEWREPVAEFEALLATEYEDTEGNLKPTRRVARVKVYEPIGEEEASLYELGIPVVPTGDRFHVSVEQKVPISLDRTNLVTPGYLRGLRALVLNETVALLTKADASEKWVDDALESDEVHVGTVGAALTHRFGEKRVAYDPSDPEANKLAMSQGYTVIHGGTFSAKAWGAIRTAGAALPAGRVTPSPKPYGEGPPRKELPEENWTEGMSGVVAFAQWFHEALIGEPVGVSIVNDPGCRNFAAAYMRGHLDLNLTVLGRAWFNLQPGSTIPEKVVDLLIHEYGHHSSGDHLSSDYYKALTKLAAKAVTLAIDEPAKFVVWARRYK